MRKLLIIAALWASSMFGAISSSPVQQVACNAATNAGACSSSGVVMTITISAPGAGNALIATFGSGSGTTATVASITGGGVSWVKGKTCNATRNAEIWYGLASSGSGTSVVVTANGSPSQVYVNLSEWSGVAASGAVDQSGCTSVGSATQTTASLTITNAGDLLIACDRPNQAYSSGPTSSFTALTSPPTSGQLYSAYYLPGTTGTYSTSWTTASAASNDTAIVAFFPAVAGKVIPAVY